MDKITHLDDAALAWLLDTLGKYPQPNDSVKRTVHDLFVHQVELEQQNRELQEMQEKLEESRDRYADLYDFAPIAYVTVDRAGAIKEINLVGATILGRERRNLIGASLAGFAEAGKRRAVLSFLRRLLDGEEPGTEVFSLNGTDGRETIVRAQGRADTSVGLGYIALLDITATQLAEQALSQCEENDRLGADKATHLVSCHAATGDFIYVSPSFQPVLGYKPEELIGRPVFDYLHQDELDGIRAAFAGALSNKICTAKGRVRRKQGDLPWFGITCRGVGAGASGGGVFVVLEYSKTSGKEGP